MTDITDTLRRGLAARSNELALFQSWMKKKVQEKVLEKWINGDLVKAWGVYQDDHLQAACTLLGLSEKEIIKCSDFRRAFQSPYGKLVGDTLKYQYRMADPIGSLVSTCFYESKLENGNKEWFDPLQDLLPNPLSAIVTWIDMSAMGNNSYDESAPGRESRSFINKSEIKIIISLIKALSQNTKLMETLRDLCKREEYPIGVICTYSAQKQYLYKKLSEEDWYSELKNNHIVKIDTVDSYQGKENRIIILSLTRNNAEKRQGFLREKERINVSLSRAMDRLYIVGASRMWSGGAKDHPLPIVLNYITDHQDGINFNIVDSKLSV